MGQVKKKDGGKWKPGLKQNPHKPYKQQQFTSLERQKHAVKLKMQKKQETKARLAAEAETERKRIKEEKEQRLLVSKKKRLERTKALSKRTQRGQPLMKDRMQLLLKQIEEMKRS